MSDLQVRIRNAQPADLAGLVSLLAALFAIEEDFVADESRQLRGLALMLANERGCVLVAEAQGQVVGMCTGQLLVSTAEGGLSLLVEDVVVDEQWRGRGVGR
ncbi:MAG: GNAT family N-acetyltransferase, partial [Desulfobulbaceae bacterium]